MRVSLAPRGEQRSWSLRRLKKDAEGNVKKASCREKHLEVKSTVILGNMLLFKVATPAAFSALLPVAEAASTDTGVLNGRNPVRETN